MGSVVKSVGNMLGMGGGGGAAPVLDRSKFDLSKQSKKYEDLLDAQRQQSAAQNQQLSDMLMQQATGQGPLANAALKAASNRSLAQSLAAAQAAQANPLNARNLMQQRGQANRDLAELSMQNRIQSQNALGQQLASQANIAGNQIGQGFGIAKAPVDMQSQYEQARFGADVARQNAIQQQQSQIGGALLGAAGTALGSYLSKAHGGVVRGPEHKASDSVENDVVPHALSAGEMVVPKSVVADGPKAIKDFAQVLLELEKDGPSDVNGFAAVAALKHKAKKK